MVVVLPFVLRKMLGIHKTRNKESGLNDMRDGIKLFRDVIRTYLIKICRAPLGSIISENNLDLNIMGASNPD